MLRMAKTLHAKPIILPSNQPPHRVFLGGDAISKFRSEPEKEPYTPEDWIASTTCCNGQGPLGLTRLSNGRLLVDEVNADPEYWLGREHLKKYGVDTKLLVKLLHAGQRGPVHAHPSGSFARQHSLGFCGKAEAWYILEPGDVHLGLKRNVSPAELLSLTKSQDTVTMLDLLHHIPVKVGQTVFVPAGLLHSIDKGVFLLEVQEPSDLAVILEWKGLKLDGTKDGHLGLGFDAAMGAVETRARTGEEISALIGGEEDLGNVLPLEATRFFRFERVRLEVEYSHNACFSVMVVLDGTAEMISSDESVLSVDKGSTILIPFAAGDIRVRGSGEVIFVRPPTIDGHTLHRCRGN